MDIRQSIDAIEEKYGLKDTGGFYEASIKTKVAEILNQIPVNKTVAIRGAGEHTSELLSLQGCNINFKYIFDYAVQKETILEIAGKKFIVYP